MKQYVTLTGLGSDDFLAAVEGTAAIYQEFKGQVEREGGRLREWSPGLDGKNITLTFANHYLTKSKEAGDETPLELVKTVDPFNILGPHLQNQVHLQENVVEYWEKQSMCV